MKFSLSTLLIFLSLVSFAQVNQVDAQGRKQGIWQKKYKGIHVYKYKGQFKDDKPVGTFTYFYESSKTKAVIKHDPNSNRSVAYYYHENGALMSHGIFRNQVKDSVWLNFGPSQRISNTETYVNGVLHGKKVVYYVPELVEDKSQIPSAVFMYVNGVLNGPYKEYHQNTKTKVNGQYKNNKRDGIWEHYHPNGRKMSLYRYKMGVKHGWWMSYDNMGKEQYKEYFYYGSRLTGDKLKAKMKELKELGINPNQ